MTKEEKIKEAYGENWELVKEKVNDDGWIKDREFTWEGFKPMKWQTTDHDNDWYDTSRPISIKGIENNNGWIKIESEEDLPKEEINCFYRIVVSERYSNAGVYINCGRFSFKSLMHSTTQYFTCDDIIRHHFTKVTHYKPIELPNEPLY